MTAGIYTARKKLKTLIVSKDVGGQMAWSSDIENYSGFSAIDGAGLTKKFRDHVASLSENIEFKEGVEITSLEKNITSFEVTDTTGTHYYSKAVILASGKVPKRLGIPGEDTYFGHGVSVCATCDAPLYRGKEVAVIGGGNSAMDALLALSKVAKRIYAINLSDSFVGDEVLKSKISGNPAISFLYNTKTLSIEGQQVVTGLRVLKNDNTEAVLPVQGVFIEAGYVPSNEYDRITEKNELGEIKVNHNLQTSVPGIFAAGDVNDAWGDQIIIAAGEGSKAALAAADYLNKIK